MIFDIFKHIKRNKLNKQNMEDKMVSITLSVPEEIKKEMDMFPEMNWSTVAREAIEQRLIMLEKFREFTKNSEFTEEDALKFGREVTEKAAKRHKIR